MSVKNRRTSLRTTINFQLGYDENTAISMTVKIPMNANYVIHRDILRHQISQKQGTVSTKTRSEVRGGGKKPWRQKGTGRARAGSSRSPLWKGGGVIFGPKPRTVSLKVNKKERKLALKFLMIQKLMTGSANGTMRIIPSQYDTLEEILATKQKTKAFSTYVQSGNIDLNEKLLLIVSKKSANVKLATRNLKNVELISASNLKRFLRYGLSKFQFV